MLETRYNGDCGAVTQPDETGWLQSMEPPSSQVGASIESIGYREWALLGLWEPAHDSATRRSGTIYSAHSR
jgi:hypothetical protein